jgi:hypothetical protein
MIYLLVLIFIISSVIVLLPIRNKGVKENILFFLGFILILLAGFRGKGVDRDYDNYVQYFKESAFGLVEPSFVVISKFLKLFTSDPIFVFVVFALLGVSLKIKAIKQLSNLWLLSLTIYISYFFILHEMTQIRAGVASAILLLCIKPLYDRDWKKFFLLALLATSFHYSAIIIFPFWFLGQNPRKIWLALSVPIAYIIYFLHVDVAVIPIPIIRQKIEGYKSLQEIGNAGSIPNDINVFNLLFLAKVAIFYFLLWKYDIIAARNKYVPLLMKVYCISISSFLIFASLPVLAFRLNELCGIVDIILIPLLFYTFKMPVFARATVIFIGFNLLCIILFYEKLLT